MSRELEDIIKEADELIDSSRTVPEELINKSLLASIAALAGRLAKVEAKVRELRLITIEEDLVELGNLIQASNTEICKKLDQMITGVHNEN